MNIVEHGKELIDTEKLICKPNDWDERCKPLFQNFEEWGPDSDVFSGWESQETICYFQSEKTKYESLLHFAWAVMFYIWDIDNKDDALTTIKDTQFKEIECRLVIQESCRNWLTLNESKLPNKLKSFLLINDWDIKFIVWEDQNSYFGWSWRTLA